MPTALCAVRLSSAILSSAYAAIDLGTNICLLLVARWDGSRLIPLAQELRVVRLGAGVGRTGRLSEEATTRVSAAISRTNAITSMLAGCRLSRRDPYGIGGQVLGAVKFRVEHHVGGPLRVLDIEAHLQSPDFRDSLHEGFQAYFHGLGVFFLRGPAGFLL